MRNFSTVSAAAALLALTACGSSREIEGIASAGACTGCHGGRDNGSGAPPFDTQGVSTATSPSVGAHTAHVSAGVACGACHLDPRTSSAKHRNGTADVDFSALADPTGVATYERGPHTCSTYCHRPVATAGTLPTPAWNNPAVVITACRECHPANGAHGSGDTMTGAHGMHRCARCHGTSALVGCQGCHLGYQRQILTTPAFVNPALHVDGAVQVLGTTVPLHNGAVIRTDWNAGTRSCSTTCHTIPAHGPVTNPQTWP